MSAEFFTQQVFEVLKIMKYWDALTFHFTFNLTHTFLML